MSALKVLDLIIVPREGKHGVAKLGFSVRKMINGGFTGRDQEAVRKHIEELKQEGISPPPYTPLLFPVLSDRITYSGTLEVLNGATSGEAEYVLFLTGDSIYIGVGSDHTARDVEVADMAASKQIYPNVIAQEVWRYEDVADHWDQLLLCSYLDRDRKCPHQCSPLAAIINPEDLLRMTRGYVADNLTGTVILSGTVPNLSETLGYSDYFLVELVDEKLGRTLSCGYSIETVQWFQVPHDR